MPEVAGRLVLNQLMMTVQKAFKPCWVASLKQRNIDIFTSPSRNKDIFGLLAELRFTKNELLAKIKMETEKHLKSLNIEKENSIPEEILQARDAMSRLPT